MTGAFQTVISLLFAALFLGGIRLMHSPRTAVAGNLLGALGMLGAIVATLGAGGLISIHLLWASLFAGTVIGYVLAIRVTMIRMPQMVALLNGLGGAASAGAAIVVMTGGRGGRPEFFTAALALLVGCVTFSGSMVAALKLDRKLPQRPMVLPLHTAVSVFILMISGALVAAVPFVSQGVMGAVSAAIITGALLYGIVFTIRIGGADMPITISLLNSLSGLAASIAGFAVRDLLLITAGAIVGSAGLILTRIMCRAMNRSLMDILLGGAAALSPFPPGGSPASDFSENKEPSAREHESGAGDNRETAVDLLRKANTIIIAPGYGMALSQAQHQVKELFDLLEKSGKDVRFAIHPVAGRMPGHMNVLLAEADVPYEKLFEMEAVNHLFPETDVAIVVGANDVVNPAASTAQGTPIYGMPILLAGEAKFIVIFNKDTRPGYAGVENPLYHRGNVALFLGDAAEEIAGVTQKLRN